MARSARDALAQAFAAYLEEFGTQGVQHFIDFAVSALTLEPSTSTPQLVAWYQQRAQSLEAQLATSAAGRSYLRQRKRTVRELDTIVTAVLTSDSSNDFCHQLEMSWPTARRCLWENRAAVLAHVGNIIAKKRLELGQTAFNIDKSATIAREQEIRRLQELWAYRYLHTRTSC